MDMDAAPQQPISKCHRCNTYHTRSATRLSNSRATDSSISDSESEDESFIPANNSRIVERPTDSLRNEPIPTIDIPDVPDSGEAMNSANDRDHELTQQREMPDSVAHERVIEKMSS